MYNTISIHALLAESDGNPYAGAGDPVISIHALLAESDAEELDKTRRQAEISIHALLAESDSAGNGCGHAAKRISIHALLAESDGDCIQCCGQVSADFYPRSPCGERLRRATGTAGSLAISIHALLAESDTPAV